MANGPKPLQLDRLHSRAATPTMHGDAIQRAMFNRIMSNHRALPLLFPLIGVLVIATLTTTVSRPVVLMWAVAVVAIWAEIALFSMRYFAGRLSSDPRKLSTSLALRYLNANAVWSAMLVMYWSPSSQGQDFFLLLLFISHLSVATATTAYEWRIYFACTLPITSAIAAACILSGDGIYYGVAALIVLVYLFMLTVAKQMIAQAESAIALRLEQDDLIRDLAKAKAGSDSALREAEQANERLKSSERRFRALVDNAFDGITIIDPSGNIKFTTDAVARMFDATPSQLVDYPAAKLATDEYLPVMEKTFYELLEAPGNRSELAVWARTFSGRKIWIETSANNMVDDPSIGGVVMNVRDATERMNTDSELQMHLSVLEKLATNASMEDVLTGLAEAMEALKPGMRATVLLLDDDNRFHVAAAPSMAPLYRETYEGMVADSDAGPCGQAVVRDQQLIMANASTHWAFKGREAIAEALDVGAAWSHPIHARDGRVLGGVTMIYRRPGSPSSDDVNFLEGAAKLAALTIERRRADQRLSEALRAAEIANHSKSQFLANMSHELRTPLNAIIGFSEMIREEMFGPVGAPEYSEYIGDIHSSGRHLLALINDILDISKIEAGQFELDETWIDLATSAAWSTDLVRHRAHENHVTLKVEIDDALERAFVDERAIKQILLNLLSNATKFTPAGGTVTLSMHPDPASGDLRIAVCDTGIGIEPHLISKVMEPFGQAEGPMARSFGGTGLGLPITKSLTELHGGTLALDSTPGEGTCVTITLPEWRLRATSPDSPADDDPQGLEARTA